MAVTICYNRICLLKIYLFKIIAREACVYQICMCSQMQSATDRPTLKPLNTTSRCDLKPFFLGRENGPQNDLFCDLFLGSGGVTFGTPRSPGPKWAPKSLDLRLNSGKKSVIFGGLGRSRPRALRPHRFDKRALRVPHVAPATYY